MYKKVNKLSEIQLKVLELFTAGFNKELYIREVQKMLEISPRTAQLALDCLENKAVLESSSRGKIKLYKIKKGIIARSYLAIAEMHKKALFLEKNSAIYDIVEKILPLTEGIAAVFGSYARGTEKDSSDLDLFVAGGCNRKKIGEVSVMYGIKINVKTYSLPLFRSTLGRDILIKEVVENHILIRGAEEFIEAFYEKD